MSKDFLIKYLVDLADLLSPNIKTAEHLLQIKEIFVKANEKGNKIIIVGNGGSAAIASHVSVDLTKNAGIRSINLNEPDLITCFSNDYGYEHWVQKAVEFYGDKDDIFVGISSSGTSRNILNGCLEAKKRQFSKVITLSGFESDNPLRGMGDINLWINSKAYNFVENIHQIWLLAVVDMIIGKTEYTA